MNVKRYFGKTAREALQALKSELGADAIVLSNRAVAGGVEIIALPADAIGALPSAEPAAPARRAAAPAPAAKPARPRPTIAEQYGLENGEAPEAEDDYRVSLQASRATPRPAAAAPRRAAAPQPQGKIIRPFNPPRVQPAQTVSRAPAPQAWPDEVMDDDDPFASAAFSAPMGAQAYQANVASANAPTARKTVTPWQPPRAAAPKAAPAAAPKAAPRRAAAPQAETEPVSQTQATPAPTLSPAMQQEARQNAERIRALQADNERLMAELTGIRAMIERQLTSFAWDETRRRAPARAQVVGELLQAGFAARLARKLGDAIPEGLDLDEARTRVKDVLSRRLRVANADADLIDEGGIYALVGPTGVGKTTTTAKIAARAVVRHGANRLALITTDGYRIGAQEQLRIYGRILGVPVFPVRDGNELQRTLAQLRDKHLVLIDTVGMSQRDRMVAHQAAMLAGAGNVRRLLLLNATARGDTLDDVVHAWKGPDLAGCIFSKTDEAASLAPALGAVLAHDLNVYYLTNGQRVPEDLHLPNRAYLLNRALHVAGAESPWRLDGEDAALLLAANGE